MTTSPRNGDINSELFCCSRRSKAPHKWLLALCWFMVLAHIWLAPDGDDSDEFNDHPSFGEPEREERIPRRSESANHEVFGDDINRVAGQETVDAIEFIQGVGGESRKATKSSLDVKDSVDTIQKVKKKPLERIQKSYLKESAEYSKGIKSDDLSGKISKVSHVSAKNTKISDTATIISDDTDADAPINETKAEIERIEMLPEALQPVTYTRCCIPAFTDEERKDVSCFGTCFNERACNDPNYPFNSAEEKAMLPSARFTLKTRKVLRHKCKSPEKLTPPVEWCQTPPTRDADDETTHNKTTATAQQPAHLVRGLPPAGCSQISNGGGSGPFQHAILFPAAKLAFCGIPKVGITQWEQFLRFYMGAKDYPSLPHYKMDRVFFQFDQLDPRAQRKIWEDEEWTWAAFVRDPAERLLSAYLDKIKSKEDKLRWIDSSLTFEGFINSLSTPSNFTNCDDVKSAINGLSWCSDPHWRPQVYSCGISERLDRFQFIGDIQNAADQTRELLGHVGLWESHGKRFINGGVQVGRNPWCNVMSHPHNHTRHVGFQQKDEVSNSSAAKLVYGHSKGSKGKMETYYTPGLLKRVQDELYADDYNLWKLVNANGIKMSKGKDLAPRLSKKCSSYVLTRPLP